jgi:hypothetical protein
MAQVDEVPKPVAEVIDGWAGYAQATSVVVSNLSPVSVDGG